MRRLILILISFFIFSCKSTTIATIQFEGVTEIIVTSTESKEKHKLTDKEKIRMVTSEYFGSGVKKLRKFIAKYEVDIIYDNSKKEKYLVNATYYSYKGITYEMKKDFSDFVSKLK